MYAIYIKIFQRNSQHGIRPADRCSEKEHDLTFSEFAIAADATITKIDRNSFGKTSIVGFNGDFCTGANFIIKVSEEIEFYADTGSGFKGRYLTVVAFSSY